jgi:hypothetical protein
VKGVRKIKKYVLITSGFWANKVEIREDNESGKLLYTTEKSILSSIILKFLSNWYNPVNFVFKGHNDNRDFKIKDIARNRHILIEDDKEIGLFKGRKLLATRYRFWISLGGAEYFYEGDSVDLITKAYQNSIEVGVFKIYNQNIPHFDWQAEVISDMDKRVVASALLYNYLIWGRV